MTDDRPPQAAGAHPSAPIPPGAIAAEPMAHPPIPLDPSASPAKTAPGLDANIPKKAAEPKDTFRELLETVVFVVVLVLMLRTFLAEAFVIPTGSMATTLFGYHHKVICAQCGYLNYVNASSEAERPPGVHREQVAVVQCICENCRFRNIVQPLPGLQAAPNREEQP